MDKQSDGFVIESLKLRRDLELIGQGIATILGETAKYGKQGEQVRRAQLCSANVLAHSALEAFECVYFALDSDPPVLLPSGRFSEAEWPVYVHSAEYRDIVVALTQCARMLVQRADAAYSGNPPERLSNSEFASAVQSTWAGYDALCANQKELFKLIDETGGRNFPKRCQLSEFKEPLLRLSNACHDYLLAASGRRDGFVRFAQRIKDGQFSHLRERASDAGVIGMIWQVGSGISLQLTSVDKLSRTLAEQAGVGTVGTSQGFLLAARDVIAVAGEFSELVLQMISGRAEEGGRTTGTAEA